MDKSMTLVVRTLSLLKALNKQSPSTLRILHEMTGIPKPTIHRLLVTLKNEGYVRSDAVKGVYSLTKKVLLLSEGYTEHELVVELGIPILLRATRESGLPLAIGIAERSQMVVRYSSMPYSPIGPVHTTIGNSHGMIHSAMGQVYMAYCGDAERERLINWLESGAISRSNWQVAERELRAQINLVRKQGYALRQPDTQQQSATLAVPIVHQDGILATLSITTFSSLLINVPIGDFVDLLRRTANEVSRAVDKYQSSQIPGDGV